MNQAHVPSTQSYDTIHSCPGMSQPTSIHPDWLAFIPMRNISSRVLDYLHGMSTAPILQSLFENARVDAVWYEHKRHAYVALVSLHTRLGYRRRT